MRQTLSAIRAFFRRPPAPADPWWCRYDWATLATDAVECARCGDRRYGTVCADITGERAARERTPAKDINVTGTDRHAA